MTWGGVVGSALLCHCERSDAISAGCALSMQAECGDLTVRCHRWVGLPRRFAPRNDMGE